jgi:hypothetical protein
MRTLLSQFCEEFDSSVRPLLEPLRRSAETLAEHPDRNYSRDLLPGLLEVSDQFSVLADKVAGQQAYVLIFGPLKSGKSTLMNAMSAAYVSEVTSLPAYPCMVYVSDAEKREFTLTRYNGDQETLHDPAALRMQVARAHTDLADRIRQADGQEEEFDPAYHFDEAIRRIDVRVPAGELAQSGSVLVDTPGLYSRMKFGYDRMTKEFRDAAACAIFVVKTDNLFLEQVFEEFTDLLDLFSRIFLVVNLDGTKKDVMPDGTLAPSLESDDPIRIVEAFENLVMSAPLKKAADEGRLRIYPVDLMKAAAQRLSGETASTDDQVDGIVCSGQADFDEFMCDLSDYLNSTDYLVAFLGDSLRRALALLGETDSTCAHPAVATLAEEVATLEEEQATARAKLDAIGRLDSFDWNESLTGLKNELLSVGERESEAIAERTEQEISSALDTWFQGDASLKALVKSTLEPLLEASQRKLALAVHGTLTEHVAAGAESIHLPREITRDLASVDLRFDEFGRGGLDGVDPIAGIGVQGNPLPIEEIPVRKSIWDWILFRSQARVQRNLFGAPNSPSARILRQQKARRMGAAAREAMQNLLADYQASQVPELLNRLALRIFRDYARTVVTTLSARLLERREALTSELGALETRLREYRKVLNHFEELSLSAANTREMIEQLARNYREADPDLLIQPIEGGDEAVEVEVEVDEELEIVPHRALDEPVEESQLTEASDESRVP